MGDTSIRRKQGSVSALLALVVVALLIGLLGMHSLSAGHGVMPGQAHQADGAVGATAHAGTGAVMTAAMAAHETATAGMETTTDRADRATVSKFPGEDDGMGGMMLMLCLAVLGAAAGIVLRRLLGGRLSRWRVSVGAGIATALTTTPARRPSGPPPVWEFSVIRC